MKKKLLSLVLAASLLSVLCACGSPAGSSSAPQSAPESKAESAAAPETSAPAPDAAPAEAASRVVTGDLTEDDYRQTIANLESSGLGRMDEIYAGAYARYMENKG